MALTDDGTSTTMLVQPSYGVNNGGFGFGGDWAWIILLLLAFGGGFGGFGGFGGADGLYPWLNNSQNVNGGFRDQMLQSNIGNLQNSVTGGFGDLQNSLCAGFAGVNATVNGGVTALSQQMNANQLSALERSFAAQTANTAGMNALQAQLAQCCCDNRLATAQTQSLVLSENCADRAALSDGIRDILAATQAQTQTILDKMCQQEIENLKTQNNILRDQVLMRDFAANQTAQTAALVADNTAQTQYIVNRVAPYPIPAYTVPNPSGATA